MLQSTSDPKSTPRAPATRRLTDEVYQHHRTLLRRLGWPEQRPGGRKLHTIGVTSCYQGEGVSTVAMQLGATAARQGDRRVLLVEADVARPALSSILELPSGPGLVDAVLNGKPAEETIVPSGLAGLSVIPAGIPADDHGRIYDSPGLPERIDQMTSRFELVVFDMPPATDAGSVIPLAGLLDGIILVVEAERVRREVVRRAKELLVRAEARLLGVVLNKRRQHVPNWLYRTL
jgi:capsular exopolysaccharide synthesis family protein